LIHSYSNKYVNYVTNVSIVVDEVAAEVGLSGIEAELGVHFSPGIETSGA